MQHGQWILVTFSSMVWMRSITGGFYRLSIPAGKLEHIADLASFAKAPENWYGVALDGAPLASRGVAAQEIYAMKRVLP